MIYIFFRITSFFLATSIIFPNGTPNIFKVCFSILLSVMIGLNIDINLQINTTFELLRLVFVEVTNGLILGYMVNICFYSIRMAGKLIDNQLGLSMASTYDPTTQSQATVIENLMYLTGVVVFFQINGHHILINSMQNSFELIPIGKFIIDNNITYILKVFLEYFIIGIKLAIPIIVVLIITDLITGIISRSISGLNVMIIGMPLKMLVGILIIISALPLLIDQIQELFKGVVDVLDGTLAMNNVTLLPLGMLLFSSDKTEEATPKKKKDERKKGNVAKSKEVSNAFTLIGGVICVYTMADYIIKQLKIFIATFLNMDFSIELSGSIGHDLFTRGIITFAKIFLPIGLVVMVFGVISNIMQTGLFFSKEAIKPKFSKLNPISGFKNMFSQKTMVSSLKNTILLIILGYIGYSFMIKNYEDILKISHIYFPYIIYNIVDIVKKLLNIALMIAVIIGSIDFAYQLYSHKKQMKMTKQEIKEEFKQAEGDPLVKSKIKQKQRQISSQRMIQNAKDASVIITNPTHISIAIRYERGKDDAPVVVSKGADVLAMKIREIAKENDIPIIENKPLARMMYKKVEVDEQVPVDMYEAVAGVLVAVYKIKNRYKKNM